MDSSEDEAEKLPELVSNYYFLDHEDEPISFSGLPLMWSEHEEVIPDGDALKDGLFLHGSADKGLRTIFKEVRAWKIELNNVSPEIYVLSKENTWLKLQKPRKCYEDTIRSVLITVNSLHYLKRNPEASAKSLWNYMANVFSMYEVRPAAKDLGNHMSLISEAVKRDDSIAKCKLIASFLGENSLLKKLSSEDDQIMPKPGFIAEDDKINAVEDSLDTEEEEEDVFDYVCSICDNGGKLLCCEGRCMRSFHPTIESGEDSVCESLGFTDAEVEAIQQFICRNCECKQHQCYACGNLGSSDKSSGAEVFACVSATCGRFYHPNCVAELLHPGDEDAAKELQKTIAEGKSFTCPIHKCCVCGKGENKRTPELQFAVCRRCPRSYHRKCLPREVTFEDSTDEDVITRAWEGLLPNRVLIYCLKHELDEQLRTPVRNHIKFPHLNEEKTAVCVNRKRQQPELSSRTGKKFVEKKCSASDEYVSRASTKRTDPKERLSSPADRNIKSKKSKVLSQQEISKKEKMENVCGQSSKNSKKVMLEGKSSSAKKKEDNVSLGQLSYPSYMEGSESELVQHEKEDRSLGSETASKKLDSLPKLDAESERRIHDIIKDAASSLSMKDVLGKHKNPSTHTRFLKSNVDKAITLGKLEGAVEALRTALQKIEEGVSIEDAQAVCDPDVLNQIFKWKDKLKVYLSPFIFGMRYTSFGRHFTKVDKLQEVVGKLHWYVQNGDMIVDFCCGANDFSCLIAKKLEETGKRCSYKNYDLFPAKNTFNFERRDWMSVNPKELPHGNRLIMGLNPPFGVNASLANKFIDKALEFKPKLLILIVPSETQRLDKKKSPYDLVWEDGHFLSGKSFYLPGCVNENDKQMDQWNLNPPVLYLWSRPAWTSKHRVVALKQGHLEEKNIETPFVDSSGIDRCKQGVVSSVSDNGISIQTDCAKEIKENPILSEGQKGSFSRRKEGPKNQETQYTNGSRKRQRDKIAEEVSQISRKETNIGPSVNAHPRRPSDISLDVDAGISNYRPLNKSVNPDLDLDFASGLDIIIDGIGRTYGLNNDDYYSRERLPNRLSPQSEYRGLTLESPRVHLRSHDYGPSSISEADERYWRDLDIKTQIRLYGRQEPDPPLRGSFPAFNHFPYPQSQPTTPSYRLMAPQLAEPSHQMNAWAIPRYPPCFNELNPPRVGNNSLPPPPNLMRMSRPGIYHPPPPQTGYRCNMQGLAPDPCFWFS